MSKLANLSAAALLSEMLYGCAPAPVAQTPDLPHVDTLHKHEHDRHHEEDEILVLDPTQDYLRALPELGLKVKSIDHLSAMNAKL